MQKRPEDKQKVFALLSDGTIATHYWSNSRQQMQMFYLGNIFETEEDAQRERQRRTLEALRDKSQLDKPVLQIRTEGETDFLIVDDRYIIDFKDILKACEEWKKCQRA